MARGRSEGGGGFAAVFVTVVVLGLIVKYIWWIVAAAALVGASVGLFFAGRALMRHAEERRELAEQQEFELRRRADRQRRWLLAGDPRAIYGQEGAAAMRTVSPRPSLPRTEDQAAQELEPIATLATTAGEVATLVNDKPDGWEWALFTSLLVQRTTGLLPRLRDSELGFTPANTTRVHTGPELARILVGLIDEMLATCGQLESFMAAPAFMASFRDRADGTPADAGAIKHVGDRVMDYHERLLELSERCRGLSAPSQYADVLADCARLLDIPLQSYCEFIDELVDVVEAIPKVLQHATGDVHLGAVVLCLDIDDKLRSRVFKRLAAISRS